jgi:hypothetical protein
LGGALVLVGLVIWLGPGKTWLGHLPGDIHIQKGNASFHFPIVTCILISVLISFLFWMFRR